MRGLVGLLLVLTACAGAQTALRERTDALLLDYRSRHAQPVPADAPPAGAWEPGQYLVYAVTRAGRTGLVRYAVEEQTQEGIWLAVQALDDLELSDVRVLLRAPPSGEDAASLARRVLVRATRSPMETFDFETDARAPVSERRAALAPLWESLRVTPRPSTQAAVTVPAGRFEACAGGTVRVVLLGERLELSAATHPHVPLSGVVEAHSADGLSSMVLVEYGDDGRGELF